MPAPRYPMWVQKPLVSERVNIVRYLYPIISLVIGTMKYEENGEFHDFVIGKFENITFGLGTYNIAFEDHNFVEMTAV